VTQSPQAENQIGASSATGGSAEVGLIGLAVMGQNLARNIASRGMPVLVHNRTSAVTDAFVKGLRSDEPLTGVASLAELVEGLRRPRKVIIMVKAGPAVDAVLDQLLELLEAGDVVVDGGNSFYLDTVRRQERAAQHDVSFLGVGISGGEEGALHGPSIMPGGDREAYGLVEPILTRIAAQVDDEPCCTYIGPGGAGHYVKMVHNGIEYADIQLIAEAYDVLRRVAGMSVEEIAEVFAEWNRGDLESFLIEITSIVLAKNDASTGQPLVDVIIDEAEQKGTGRWTAQDALELGVPAPAMTTAVYARSMSARRQERLTAAGVLKGPEARPGDKAGLVDDVRDALYASKIVAYAEGLQQLSAASRQHGWDLDLSAIATIWRGGCIIRARFLERIRESLRAEPETASLLLLPYFTDALAAAQEPWRRVVSGAVESGVPAPAFSAALGYYDSYRQERSPANLIQGLRDYFGAHTYHRLDRDGAFHTRWGQDGSEAQAGPALAAAAGQG
jgi:6-phosphogluconate dehydrogenase